MTPPAHIAALLTTGSTLKRYGPYEITDDPDRVDLDVVHAVLSRESYWRQGGSRGTGWQRPSGCRLLSVHLATSTPSMVPSLES